MFHYLKRVFSYFKRLFLSIRNFFSKLLAYFLYAELCLVYYATSTTLGRIILTLTFVFGFFGSEAPNTFQVICWLYTVEVVQAGLTFWVLFRSPRFRDWFYSHLNREKVDKMVYSSPAMSAFVTGLSKYVGPTIGLEIGSGAGKVAGSALIYGIGRWGADTDKKRADTAALQQFEKFQEIGVDRKAALKLLKEELAANKAAYGKSVGDMQSVFNSAKTPRGIATMAVDSMARNDTIAAVSTGLRSYLPW